MKLADITFQNNVFSVTGDIDFSNVMSVYQKSLNLLQQHSSTVFDFSRLTSSDSAGLALLIEWARFGKRHQKAMQFTHLTQDLAKIAKAAGIEGILGI